MPQKFRIQKIICGICIFIFGCLYFPDQAAAQTPTSPSAQIQAQGNIIDDILAKILGFINPKLDNYDKANLPPVNIINYTSPSPATQNSSVKGTDTNIGYQTTQNYALGTAIRTPDQTNTNFSWLPQVIKDLLGIGDKKAEEFVQSCVPAEAAQNAGSMDKAYSLCECAHLPGGCNSNGQANWIGAPIVVATPTPGGSPTVTPVPSSYPIAPGTCSLGINYCSADYLRSYFGPDETIVNQASEICNVESDGSNPMAKNFDCISGKSRDYSVGLFQINLLAHCDGAFAYTQDERGRPIPVMPCQIIDQTKLNQCLDTYYTGANAIDNNIKKAVDISNHGTDWSAWGAAYYCKILTK